MYQFKLYFQLSNRSYLVMLVYKFLNPRFCIFFFSDFKITQPWQRKISHHHIHIHHHHHQCCQTGLFYRRSYFKLSPKMLKIVSMLFTLGLFATHGDLRFPFLLAYYAQVTLFPHTTTSLSKAKTVIQGKYYNFSTNHKSNDKLN